MLDPFSALLADGLNDRLADIVSTLAKGSRPSVQNIHALLAYQSEPGVREKFDRRFGEGAADIIIGAAQKADGAAKIGVEVRAIAAAQSKMADAVASLTERVSVLADRIEAMPHQQLCDGMAALPGRIADAMPAPIAPPIAAPVNMAPVTAGLKDLAAEIRALTDLTKAPRHIITDANGDPVGVRIGNN